MSKLNWNIFKQIIIGRYSLDIINKVKNTFRHKYKYNLNTVVTK